MNIENTSSFSLFKKQKTPKQQKKPNQTKQTPQTQKKPNNNLQHHTSVVSAKAGNLVL